MIRGQLAASTCALISEDGDALAAQLAALKAVFTGSTAPHDGVQLLMSHEMRRATFNRAGRLFRGCRALI